MADSKSVMSDHDIWLFKEGRHFRLYEKMGATFSVENGLEGIRFTVWAPNTEYVSLIGDFNQWNKASHIMEPVGDSGLHSIFVQTGKNIRYKYHVVSKYNSYVSDRADPFAIASEKPPETASVTSEIAFKWTDREWMKNRKKRNSLESPISIYELHVASWKRVVEEGNRSFTYRELAHHLGEYIQRTGFTHVELMPVMLHPFSRSWGYQLTGYFCPQPDFGSPDDFAYFIDYMHNLGIGVFLDWVPSHFPGDEHGLGYFDGTHLFEYPDPRKGFQQDWGSLIFDYGRPEVRSFLISSALFWLEKFHVDGFRVDAVASMLYLDYSRKDGEWLPNQYGGNEHLEAVDFLKQLNETIYSEYPDVQTFAEESTSWTGVSHPIFAGGLGFGFKWDMGWMHDTLDYFQKDPIHRRFHQDQLTFRMMYAFSENFVLSLSHDEVVHGKKSLLEKMPGDEWQRFANLRLLYSYMYALPGKKLIFMGGEFGQRREWSEERSLDWHLIEKPDHRGILQIIKDLNRIYAEEPALHETDHHNSGFRWVDINDREQSILSFLRISKDNEHQLLAVFNFTPVPRHDYMLGVGKEGRWEEIFNSDAGDYGGSGLGNLGRVFTDDIAFHGQKYSIKINIPPLGAVFFRHPGKDSEEIE